MTAFSLFCVTTRGLERSFPTPFDSAALMKKSTAKFGERWKMPRPLVGVPAPRSTLKGRPLPPLAPLPEISGGCAIPVPVVVGLVPTAELPPTTVSQVEHVAGDPAKA